MPLWQKKRPPIEIVQKLEKKEEEEGKTSRGGR